MFLQTEGKLAGCWVMRIEDEAAAGRGRGGAGPRRRRGTAGAEGKGHRPLRTAPSPTSARTSPTSSGSSACSARTSATALFARRPAAGRCGRRRRPTGRPRRCRPPFGGASRGLQRHRLPADLPAGAAQAGAGALGHAEQAEHSIHFSYEMVALSHATARELGYDAEHRRRPKPFVEVSGRKGLGVKTDDLLDRADRQGRRRGRASATPSSPPPSSRAHRRGRSRSPRCATSC